MLNQVLLELKGNKRQHIPTLQSKYSAHSAYYLGMTFINRERIALMESKFHFQIEYCNVPMVALFQMLISLL